MHNNITAQLEIQKAEAYKLIDILALLKECSLSISISFEATKLVLVGIKQNHQARLLACQALLIAQQVLLIAQQAHCIALCQPHQRAQDIMLSEAPLSLMTNPKGTTRGPDQTPFAECWQTEEAQRLEI